MNKIVILFGIIILILISSCSEGKDLIVDCKDTCFISGDLTNKCVDWCLCAVHNQTEYCEEEDTFQVNGTRNYTSFVDIGNSTRTYTNFVVDCSFVEPIKNDTRFKSYFITTKINGIETSISSYEMCKLVPLWKEQLEGIKNERT